VRCSLSIRQFCSSITRRLCSTTIECI
jgi:hypothetical protein